MIHFLSKWSLFMGNGNFQGGNRVIVSKILRHNVSPRWEILQSPIRQGCGLPQTASLRRGESVICMACMLSVGNWMKLVC